VGARELRGEDEPTRALSRLRVTRADAVEEQLRAQTMMLAEAEHRLKTSLAVITGWARTLDERWDQISDGDRRDAIRTIRRAADGLAEEATALLTDARSEILAMGSEPVLLDLEAVLAATSETLQGVSSEHLVVHEPHGENVPVEVDPAALQQVLGHLVENAVKYSEGGHVIVAAYPEGDEAVIEVRDEGIGIPVDVDLFAPFQRGEFAESHHLPGVGIGLYVVRNLVGFMGGTVSARRNEPGPGSTFTVRLPLYR
jgi:signal transduction histidine kinase